MCTAVHGATTVFPTTGYNPEDTVKSLGEERCVLSGLRDCD